LLLASHKTYYGRWQSDGGVKHLLGLPDELHDLTHFENFKQVFQNAQSEAEQLDVLKSQNLYLLETSQELFYGILSNN